MVDRFGGKPRIIAVSEANRLMMCQIGPCILLQASAQVSRKVTIQMCMQPSTTRRHEACYFVSVRKGLSMHDTVYINDLPGVCKLSKSNVYI